MRKTTRYYDGVRDNCFGAMPTPPDIHERCAADELREYAGEMPAVLRDAEKLIDDRDDITVEDAIRLAREMNDVCPGCGTWLACKCNDAGGKA